MPSPLPTHVRVCLCVYVYVHPKAEIARSFFQEAVPGWSMGSPAAAAAKKGRTAAAPPASTYSSSMPRRGRLQRRRRRRRRRRRSARLTSPTRAARTWPHSSTSRLCCSAGLRIWEIKRWVEFSRAHARCMHIYDAPCTSCADYADSGYRASAALACNV